MKLWLDDVRPAPNDSWTCYTEPWGALSFILQYGDEIEEWSLDHDLGEGIPTGYDFLCMVSWIVLSGSNIRIPDKITIHSANPIGRENMTYAIHCLYNLKGI